MLIPILLTLAAFLVIFLLFVATRPADFSITRSAIIPVSPADAFPLINDFHEWQEWSPWAKLDPDCENTFTGPAAGVGSRFTWSGNNKVGEGSMVITESRPNEVIKLDLLFTRPMKANNRTVFSFQAANGGTQVTWTMSGKNGFAGKLFGVIVNCDRMVGGQFEQGLANLKSRVYRR